MAITLSKLTCPPSEKGSILKENEFACKNTIISDGTNVHIYTSEGAVHQVENDLIPVWCLLDTYHFSFNPSLAEHDMPCLSKQCRSRSVGFWRSQLIWICTVIKYVNFYQKPWSSNLIGWKLENGRGILIYSARQGLNADQGHDVRLMHTTFHFFLIKVISFIVDTTAWSEPCENVSSGICGQRKPRSACASAQSNQGFHCPLTE